MLLTLVHLCLYAVKGVLGQVGQTTCSRQTHCSEVMIKKKKKKHQRTCAQLTQQFGDQRWSLGLWEIHAHEVDGNPRQGNGNANHRVDGVAVERDHHQEEGTQAEDHWVE